MRDSRWSAQSRRGFDDTFEHEAWNRSERDRAVLIVDSWNADPGEAEQTAVADLVAEVGGFNRSGEASRLPRP
ncbi:MAG TPA: aspartyl/asparaginyl beta-hydroxylase domain-containing protein [Rhodanobacter sp.]|nr:aspartyl/asparaginyl beta-hydroxylase domain-containing protein [Rhodanobacter sp.]